MRTRIKGMCHCLQRTPSTWWKPCAEFHLVVLFLLGLLNFLRIAGSISFVDSGNHKILELLCKIELMMLLNGIISFDFSYEFLRFVVEYDYTKIWFRYLHESCKFKFCFFFFSWFIWIFETIFVYHHRQKINFTVL